jgi:hypothetical protein
VFQGLTVYQSQFYAWLLTHRSAGDSLESLASTVVDAQVDLYPHQVEATLFALGKTIEAWSRQDIKGYRPRNQRNSPYRRDFPDIGRKAVLTKTPAGTGSQT